MNAKIMKILIGVLMVAAIGVFLLVQEVNWLEIRRERASDSSFVGRKNVGPEDSETNELESSRASDFVGEIASSSLNGTNNVSNINSGSATTSVVECGSDDNCLEIAVDEKNEDYCKEIKNPNTKSQCFSQLAILKNDYGICKKAQDYFQDSCLYSFAVAKRSTSTCDLIEIPAIKDYCLREFGLKNKGQD